MRCYRDVIVFVSSIVAAVVVSLATEALGDDDSVYEFGDDGSVYAEAELLPLIDGRSGNPGPFAEAEPLCTGAMHSCGSYLLSTQI